VSHASQTVEGDEEMIEVDHGEVEAVDTEVIQEQMCWSRTKDPLTKKVEVYEQELNVRLISQGIESNDSVHSPSRALIGGVQPNMVGGPLWQRYINRGGGRGSQYEVHRVALDPPTHPTDLGFSA
jgi:hypothetical protein